MQPNRNDNKRAALLVCGLLLVAACILLVVSGFSPFKKEGVPVQITLELPPGQSRVDLVLPGDSRGNWEDVLKLVSTVRITRKDGSTRDFSPHQFDKISTEGHEFREVSFVMTNGARVTLSRQP